MKKITAHKLTLKSISLAGNEIDLIKNAKFRCDYSYKERFAVLVSNVVGRLVKGNNADSI